VTALIFKLECSKFEHQHLRLQECARWCAWCRQHWRRRTLRWTFTSFCFDIQIWGL
jgi:hypothetical protein